MMDKVREALKRKMNKIFYFLTIIYSMRTVISKRRLSEKRYLGYKPKFVAAFMQQPFGHRLYTPNVCFSSKEVTSVDEELDAFQFQGEDTDFSFSHSDLKIVELQRFQSSLKKREKQLAPNFPTMEKIVKNDKAFAEPIGSLGVISEGSFLSNAILLGGLTGIAVSGLKLSIERVKQFLYSDFLKLLTCATFLPRSAIVMSLPLVGAAGVCATRAVFKEFSPGLAGNIDEMEKQRPVHLRPAFGKFLAASVTLGSGCSLGPEGPAVEVGVAASRMVGAFFLAPMQRQRQLLAAGAAAGVAAGFNAPLAGVFFAFEIVRDSLPAMNEMSKSGVAATLLAAVVSALTARILLSEEHCLRPSAYFLENPLLELPLYLGLGILSGLVALLFKYALNQTTEIFKKLSDEDLPGPFIPRSLSPLVGGLLCSLLSLRFPQILFVGYDTLDGLLANTSRLTTVNLLSFVVIKMVATSICLGSGLVGGTFAPALFLGATTGAAYHGVMKRFLNKIYLAGAYSFTGVPTIAYAPAYAMVGAAAVLSALFRAPLTGSLLMFELTQDYEIILPLMAAAGVASVVVEKGHEVQEKIQRASKILKAEDECHIVTAHKVQGMDVLCEQSKDDPQENFELLLGNSPHDKYDRILQEITVENAFIRSPVCLSSTNSINEAMKALGDANTDFGVVTLAPNPRTGLGSTNRGEMDQTHVFGIISLTDLQSVADQISAVQENAIKAGEKVSQEFDPLDLIPIGGCCKSKGIVAIARNTTLLEAQKTIEHTGVNYLPVVDYLGSTIFAGAISAESIRRALRIEETARILSRIRQRSLCWDAEGGNGKDPAEIDESSNQLHPLRPKCSSPEEKGNTLHQQ